MSPLPTPVSYATACQDIQYNQVEMETYICNTHVSPNISGLNDQHLGQSEHVVNHIRYGNDILGNQNCAFCRKSVRCGCLKNKNANS